MQLKNIRISVCLHNFVDFSYQDFSLLTEPEVIDRFVVIEERKRKILERKQREQRRMDRKKHALEMARKLEEARQKKTGAPGERNKTSKSALRKHRLGGCPVMNVVLALWQC